MSPIRRISAVSNLSSILNCSDPPLPTALTCPSKVSRKTVIRRLDDAGLKWRRRRQKTLLMPEDKVKRLKMSRKWLRLPQKELDDFVYSDGASFYIAKSAFQQAQQTRRTLGPSVYRMEDGSDSLHESAVGPSKYAKSQGERIFIYFCFLRMV
jgi:hypothetical protein